jgi:putative ABC transport system permease protein
MDFELFKSELMGQGVLQVTGASRLPGSGQRLGSLLVHGEGMPAAERVELAMNMVQEDFVETYQLELAEGRDFSSNVPTDTSEALVINESAARLLGWTDGAVGKELAFYNGTEAAEPFQAGRVIGVLKDFHFESLHHRVQPLVLSNAPVFNRTYLALRLSTADLDGTIAHLEEAWARLAPEWPLELNFLDARLGQLYQQEQRLSEVITAFAVLALLIACLGLFGLSAFMAEQRTKEIGIRKVMGASVPGIVALLSKDFLKLVAVAFVLAAPVAYIAMSRWLDAFAYRVDVGVGAFVMVGVLVPLAALLTVGFQAFRAALSNPVKVLRYE